MEPANAGMQPWCWQQESFYFCGHIEDTATDPVLLCLCCQFHSGILETWGDREGCVTWVLYVVFIHACSQQSSPVNSRQTWLEAPQGPLSCGPGPGPCCCWSLWGTWFCSVPTINLVQFSQLRTSAHILWLLIFLALLPSPSPFSILTALRARGALEGPGDQGNQCCLLDSFL